MVSNLIFNNYYNGLSSYVLMNIINTIVIFILFAFHKVMAKDTITQLTLT